mmetsp:Transcript_129453/g.223676  ORF Transcript_129453/g.223676 Transcript_129453/m.223676 type:complete len:99 (-) Transcript_129453:940-1236(-)
MLSFFESTARACIHVSIFASRPRFMGSCSCMAANPTNMLQLTSTCDPSDGPPTPLWRALIDMIFVLVVDPTTGQFHVTRTFSRSPRVDSSFWYLSFIS